MLSSRRVQLLAGPIALAGLFVFLGFGNAQDESKGEKIRFTTVDGVEIHGMFYAGSKRNSATVMMLHKLDEDSRKKAWTSLAETLNKEGYSVLTFDFRGHGQSGTIVEPATFWKMPRNILSVRGGGQKKETLEFKDMKPDYYPVLVNDIAAAKAFLDNRNDTGVCNTASLMVLGADTGATLGAIWLNAEWHRYAFTPANPLMGVPLPKIAPTTEGKDTIAAIWLSPTSKLGSRTISLSSLLDTPGREYAMPMFFMYSDDDGVGKNIAKACESKFKGAKKKDDKYRFTMTYAIDGGGKLTGAGLLQKSLKTEEAILEYVQGVAEAKGNEWSDRDFRKTQYVWRFPPSPPFPAKLPNEKLLLFDTYERFIR
jgi:pimeloyl-ACP methyl ester carboxylesterase